MSVMNVTIGLFGIQYFILMIRFSVVFLYYTQPFSLEFRLFFWGGGGGEGGGEGISPHGPSWPTCSTPSHPITTLHHRNHHLFPHLHPHRKYSKVTTVAMVILLSDGASAGDM